MKLSNLVVQLAFGALVCVNSAFAAEPAKRQVGHVASENLDTEQDREAAGTAFASAGLGAGKYFQYAHVPAKDHYEFGHRKGNEHHFTERHEKAHPHAGEFKTKVRWGDKHGGYGEHYWDYNHAGHDGGHGDDHGEESQNTPYVTQPLHHENPRAKRQPNPNADVEYIDESARFLAETGQATKHGGNYKWEPFTARAKRYTIQLSPFVFDPNTGRILNQETGQAYQLLPVF